MPRVVVDGRSLHVDTGGPEALAQLAVPLGPQTFLLRPSKAPPIAPPRRLSSCVFKSRSFIPAPAQNLSGFERQPRDVTE